MDKPASLIFIWLGLLGLLALTVAASLTLQGPVGLAVSLAIAFSKASLVFWFFMHLDRMGGLERIAAIGAMLWLSILLAYVAIDYMTR